MKYIDSILTDKNQRKWFYFVMAILLSFYPYKIANAYYPFVVSNIQTQFVVAVILCVLTMFIKKKRLPNIFWICVIVMFLGSLSHFFLTGDKYYYHKLINLVSAVCLIIIVYSKIGCRQFFTIYNKWILLIAIFAAVAYFIINAGVPPVTTFKATEDGREVSNWIISFAKSGGTLMNRPAGMFDEPGALGYWGCFAIGINRLFIKDLKLEKRLLIFLIFTMSMGYFMQALVFILFTYLIKGSIKNKITISLISIFIFISLCSLKGSKYEYIYDGSIGRIEVMLSGQDVLSMEGTSREKLVIASKEKFEQNPVWGVGWPIDKAEYFSDNQYETLAHDGIVGTIYQYFPYLLLIIIGIKRRDSELISIVIFLSLAVFHRPIHPNILTYFILYSLPLIYWIKIRELTK